MNKATMTKMSAGEFYFDLLALFASLVVLVLAYRISGFALSAAGTFPMVSSAVMVGSMIVVIRENCKKKEATKEGFVSEMRQMFHEVLTKNFLVFTFLTVIYIFAIEPLHFLPSSFVYITCSIIYLKGGTPVRAGLISAGTLTFIYVVFLYFFKILLP